MANDALLGSVEVTQIAPGHFDVKIVSGDLPALTERARTMVESWDLSFPRTIAGLILLAQDYRIH